MNIVLVHGIFRSGRNMHKLAQALRAQGHQCWTPTLRPSDGRCGLEALAQQLKSYIHAHVPPNTPLVLIGFSMGSIVSRVYLQLLGGAARVQAFIAISGPQQGTQLAWLGWGQGARDMRPGSSLLQKLHATAHRLQTLTLLNYWTPYDLVIVPAANSRWQQAQHQYAMPVWLHALMPSHPAVIANVVQQVQQLGADNAHAQ